MDLFLERASDGRGDEVGSRGRARTNVRVGGRGCRWRVARLCQGRLRFGLIRSEDVIIVCNKMAVAASSHHRGPGSITQKSQVWAAKQITIPRCVTVFWEAKLFNFDNVNPW